MHIRLTALSFAIAAAGFVTCGVASDQAIAGGRIIHVNSSDTSSHGGRIIRPSSQTKSTFGGRILHIAPDQATVRNEDAPAKIITPRYHKVTVTFDDPFASDDPAVRPGDQDDPQVPDTGKLHGITQNITVNRYYGTPCYSGGSLNFRAGDHFQAGGNLLKVPQEEAAFGRHACNKTRIYQRYLGFKRVYKGQVYTGFHKVYSGRRYLNGNY